MRKEYEIWTSPRDGGGTDIILLEAVRGPGAPGFTPHEFRLHSSADLDGTRHFTNVDNPSILHIRTLLTQKG